jgi:hypothetical protein
VYGIVCCRGARAPLLPTRVNSDRRFGPCVGLGEGLGFYGVRGYFWCEVIYCFGFVLFLFVGFLHVLYVRVVFVRCGYVCYWGWMLGG